MLYAKVGAMPQPSDEEQQHGRVRGSRQGITMQDLKKQTALRLAQEQKGSQQQQRNFGGKQPQHNNSSQQHNRPVHAISQPQLQYQGNTVYCGLSQSNLIQSNYYHQQYGNQNQENNRDPRLETPTPQIRTRSYEPHHEKERILEQPLLEHNSIQPRQLNWQVEMLSETSSVRSYEYDCNASSVSNAEVGSTLSGGSSQYQNVQQPRHGPFFESLSVVRDVPVSPLPQNFSSPDEKRRQSRSRESPGAKSTQGEKSNVNGQGGSRSIRSNRSTGTKLRKQQQRSPATSQLSNLEQILKPQQNHCQMRVTSPNQYRMQEQSQEEDLSSFSGYSQPRDVRETRGTKKSIASSMYQRCPVATTPKNKLPHGLTVSELKEMTRARLAAEAASEKHKQQTLLVVNQEQPLHHDNTAYPIVCHSPGDFNLVSESSSSDAPLLQFRSQSCDDNLCNKFLQPNRASPELSTTPQSQHCRHSPLCWQRSNHHSNRPHKLTPSQAILHPSSQNLPYNPMKHSNSLHSYQKYRQCNHPSQQEQHRQQVLDSLETTSVASFNSTLGSESIHSTPFLGAGLQPPSNDEGSFFGRSWSYPAGVSLGSAVENETPKSTSSSFFENSSGLSNMGVGRRSRLGSSPPGFHLEVAHEDRPLNVTVDLTLPLFETPRSNKWRLSHGEDGCIPSSLETSTPLSSRHQNMRCATGCFEPSGNRNINFSPSPAKHDRVVGSELILPPLSSDEKRGARSSGGSFSGDIPNLVAESVLFPSHQNDSRSALGANGDLMPTECNGSILSHGGAVSVSEGALYNWLNTASGVFRNTYINSTSSDTAVSDREEIAGNNERKACNNSSSWARDLIGLTNHFGSILSFSKGCSENIDLSEGIVENDQQPGNFVSRIDPEVVRTSEDTSSSVFSEPRSVQDLGSNISRQAQAQAPLPIPKLFPNEACCREGREEVSSPALSVSSKTRHRNSFSSGRKKRDSSRRRRDHGSRA